MTAAWIRLAGKYESACNAVREAEHDAELSDEEYGNLIALREAAFTALSAQSERDSAVRS